MPADTNAVVLDARTEGPPPSTAVAPKPAAAPTVLSRRKQRQMETYIAKKLKRDARPALMERLQKAAYSGEGLQSTKNLLLPVSLGPKGMGQRSYTVYLCLEQTKLVQAVRTRTSGHGG